ncbi:MAG: DUF427 domain-containing protein [Rhodobacteraceae bacterium]|nr:DUF427 domain-containing protein [Paracoccaceae bacterium]
MTDASDHTGLDLTIRPAEGKWVAYTGGAIYAETSAAIELVAGDLPPVIFFPRADVAMAFFDRSSKATHAPGMGEATHFSIDAKSKVLDSAALSYEAPEAGAEAIRDYVTFNTDVVTVEKH